MSGSMLVLLSFMPILVIFVFLVLLRWSASRAMPLAFLSVALSGFFVWKIPVNYIGAYSIDGLATAFGILYIVFGAILLLNTINESGGLTIIKSNFTNITEDRRIQVILILWIFGAFLEGSAGFGSTGAVIGPLLVGLGFPAMAAATVCMVFQSTTVSFGAVGTPVILGLSAGLGEGTIAKVNAVVGDMSWAEFIHMMGFKIAVIHGIIAIFVPLFMIMILTRFFGKNRSFSEGLSAWRFAIFGGLCLSIPYVLTAYFLGPEFPSVFGGLIGLIPAVIAAKKGWFMPKDGVWDFGPRSGWDKEWEGVLDLEANRGKIKDMSNLKAWLPYVLMAITLFITRLEVFPFRDWLKILSIKIPPLFATTISPMIELAYSPGTIFIAASIFTYWYHGMEFTEFKRGAKGAWKVVLGAGSALVLAVPMVKIFVGSGIGAAGLASMPTILAEAFAQISGEMWSLASPVVGALGAFIAGSNTLSNMMFALFQFETAQLVGLDPLWIVAVQCVGAAAGNMICVHNVVMASAAVGLLGQEGTIIRKVLLPVTYYILFAGAIGYVIMNGFALNIGTFIIALILAAIVIAIATRKKTMLE